MKKIITIAMAIAMLTLSFSALAVGVDQPESTDVMAKYVSGGSVDVYSVDVVWGGMEFDYNASNEAWNSTEHIWESTSAGSWAIKAGSSNTIQVNNHSSVGVSISLTANMTAANVTGTFSENTFTLGVPTQGENGATTKTVTFMPAGELGSSFTDYAKIGSITVAID